LIKASRTKEVDHVARAGERKETHTECPLKILTERDHLEDLRLNRS